MSAKSHALALLLSVTLAYLWLQVPLLRQYSFQIFALLLGTFLIVKRYKKAKFWHILPDWASLEITLITFAFLLIIGATGNTQSLFYPLAYVHLFFLVMTSHVQTAIVATIAIMLFHYAIEPEFTIATIQAITTLPIMLAIFLFARKQYDEAHLAKIAKQHHEANHQEDPLNHSTIAANGDDHTA